jgi:hypothetical protein
MMSNKELFWALVAILAAFAIAGTLDYADARMAECAKTSQSWNSETDKCQ